MVVRTENGRGCGSIAAFPLTVKKKNIATGSNKLLHMSLTLLLTS